MLRNLLAHCESADVKRVLEWSQGQICEQFITRVNPAAAHPSSQRVHALYSLVNIAAAGSSCACILHAGYRVYRIMWPLKQPTTYHRTGYPAHHALLGIRGSCLMLLFCVFLGSNIIAWRAQIQYGIAGEEPGRDSVLTETLAGYLANILTGSDVEAKLAAVWWATQSQNGSPYVAACEIERLLSLSMHHWACVLSMSSMIKDCSSANAK